MMKSMTKEVRVGENWPPEGGQLISFKSGDGWKTGVLQEVRWGLVWRDFILDDGRVIPEIRISGCPQPPVWRTASQVTRAEREAAEERLASMAEAGLDPRDPGAGRERLWLRCFLGRESHHWAGCDLDAPFHRLLSRRMAPPHELRRSWTLTGVRGSWNDGRAGRQAFMRNS